MKIKSVVGWLVVIYLFLFVFNSSVIFAQTSISGTATIENAATAGIDIYAYSNNNSSVYVAHTVSASNGTYTISGLSTGYYRIVFDGTAAGGNIMWYQNKPYFELAADVPATNGSVLNINQNLDAAGRLSGIVKNSSGNGIAGVTVNAYFAGNSWNVIGDAVTDVSGAYTIGNLPECDYQLEFDARLAGYKNGSMIGPFPVTNGGNTVVSDMILQEGGNVTGQVTDGTMGIEGVKIQAYNSDSGITVVSKTDASGNYSVKGLETGSWTITFDGSVVGYSSAQVSVSVVEGSTVSGQDGTLSKVAAIMGQVTDISGNGISGISIKIYNAGDSWESLTATSDSGGYYVAPNLSAGSYEVEFFDQNGKYETQWWNGATNRSSDTTVSVVSGTHTQGVDAVLSAVSGRTVWGRITESGTGKPIFSAGINLNGNNYYQANSDVSGYYIISGVQPDSYGLQVNAPWESPYVSSASITLDLTSSSNTVQHNETLDIGATFKGRVLDENNDAVQGVEVDILEDGASEGWAQYFANTDSNGYFSVQGVPAGTYKVKYYDWNGIYKIEYYNDKADFASADAITVALGDTNQLADAILSFGAAVGGRLTDSITGLPVPGVSVYYYDQYDSQSWNSYVSDTNGRYRITGLAAGNYRLQFQAKNAGYYDQFYSNKADLASATVVSFDGNTDITNINAVLTPGATISGTVTNDNGSGPLSGVNVSVYAVNNSWQADGTTVTDTNGIYSVKVFSDTATQYKLQFEKSGFVVEWYDGASGFNDATNVPAIPLSSNSSQVVSGINAGLSVAASIKGKVVDKSSGMSLQWVHVHAYPHGQSWGELDSTYTDGSGNYILSHLPTGDYDIYFNELNGYISQWYHNSFDQTQATMVSAVQSNQVILNDEQMVQPGSITGTVTDDTTGNPLESVYVQLYHAGDSSYTASAWSDAGGNYQFNNLIPATDYQVFFSISGYADQWYSVKATRDTADLISVSSGQTTANVDGSLYQRGSIAGTVTDEVSGMAVYNVRVDMYDAGGTLLDTKYTNPQGGYLFGNLPTGTNLLKFSHADYITEWYNNQTNQASATPIVVSGTGVQTADAALANIGQIAGQVIAQDTSNVLAGINVNAYTPAGVYVRGTTSDTNGNYAVGGLAPGSYQIYFYPPASSYYSPEWYDNQADSSSASNIVITQTGDVVTNINGVLERGGIVSGVVTDATNSQPVASAQLNLYKVIGGSETFVRTVITTANGGYQFIGLRAGDYIIRYTHNIYLPGDTGTFTVTPPGTVTENIVLYMGTSISGRLTDGATSSPLNGGWATLYSAAGQSIKTVSTDTNGEYVITGITAGDYKVQFSVTDYFTEWYDDKTNQASATVLTAVPPTAITNIDAVMTRGATLAGTVTHSVSSAPLSDVLVTLFDTASNPVMTTATDSSGNYKFTPVNAGTYKVGFEKSGFVPQWYHNMSNFGNADSVVLAAGEDKTGIDAQLVPMGAISGNVTDTHGNAVSNLTVEVYDTGGIKVRTTYTDNAGDYTAHDLLSGNYRVRFATSGTQYLEQWYNGKSNLLSADTVTVTAPATISGIDVVLQDGSYVSGYIKSVDSSMNTTFVYNAYVAIVNATNQPDIVAVTYSDTNGFYEIQGLAQGNYKIYAEKYPLASRWYSNALDFSTATIMNINPPTTYTNIDIIMPERAKITGRLVDSGDHSTGISNVTVSILYTNGSTAAIVESKTDGSYTVSNLLDGVYSVKFDGTSSGYFVQYYNGKSEATNADPVITTAPYITELGTNELIKSGGIHGRVTDTAGNPIVYAALAVYSMPDKTLRGWSSTDGQGYFNISLLPAGDYVVRADKSGYLSKFYQNGKGFDDATTISVTLGTITSLADIQLLHPAKISGTLVNNDSATVSNIWVVLMSDTNTVITQIISDTNGYYEFNSLWPGQYLVEYYGYSQGYILQWYNGKPDGSTADYINIAEGDDFTANVTLIRPGVITGTVRSKATTLTASAPLSGIQVQVYRASDQQYIGGDISAADGTYSVTDPYMLSGDYYVKFRGSLDGFYDQWYLGKMSVTNATTVSVVDEQTTSGIDAELYHPVVSATVISGNGSVSPVLQEVNYGTSPTVTIQPAPYWSPIRVMDSRYQWPRYLWSYDYQMNNVYEDVNISVTYTGIADIVAQSVEVTSNAFNGETVIVSWTITNAGIKTATGPWHDGVYLSADNVPGNDIYLGNFVYNNSILSSQSIVRVQTVTIPKGIATGGDYYIIMHEDMYDDLFEGLDFEKGETNNYTASMLPINIQITPSPDLIVTNVIAPQNAFSGQETIFKWSVLNQGNGGTTVSAWHDKLYLSLDEVVDSSDIELAYVRNPALLPAGDLYNSSVTVTLPNGLSGTYYVLVEANADKMVDETTTTNNMETASFVINLTPPPDLQVTEVVTPASGFSGQNINMSYKVENLGTGPTVGSFWRDYVYISTNNTPAITAGDVYLDYYNNNTELLVGGNYTRSISPYIPPQVSGTCYIKVWTDRNNNIFEHTYDNNNVMVSPSSINIIFQGPDFEVTSSSIDTPPPVLAGHNIQVSWSVENFGTVRTPNWYWQDAVYLFTNTVFDVTNATKLGYVTHYGNLDINATYSLTGTFELPRNIAGNYNVAVVVDEPDWVVEVSETNNTSTNMITAIEARPADLVATALDINSSLKSGDAVTIRWTVENQGTGDTFRTDWYDDIYITDDSTLQNQGKFLGEFRHSGALQIGDAYTNEEMIVIPFDTATGQYYLYVNADSTRIAYELPSTLSNNYMKAMVTVSNVVADLAVTGVTAPAVMQSGHDVAIEWNVVNLGLGRTDSRSWYDRVILSPSKNINDPGAIYLGQMHRWEYLTPGSSYTGTLTSAVQRDISGAYYVGVIVDYYQERADVTRSNNIAWSSSPSTITFTPAADLAVSNISAPTNAISGRNIAVSWNVDNIDAATDQNVDYWNDAVYLSRDKLFDASDIYLGYRRHDGGMAAGASYSDMLSCGIPAGLSGPMYIFVICDRNDNVFEDGREDNNVKFQTEPIMVTLPQPSDLVITSFVTSASSMMGEDIHIEYTTLNQGANAAPNGWSDAIYLSSISNWTDDAISIGRIERDRYAAPLGAGESNTMIVDTNIPGIMPGNYYVIIKSDIFNQVLESDEDNNMVISTQAVAIDAIPLDFDTPVTFGLANGRSVYYKLTVPTAGDTILVKLDGANSNAFNELYVAFGRPPTRGDFDFTYQKPFSPDQEIIMPLTRDGTYYILAYGNTVPASNTVSLTAEVIPFSIREIDPVTAGDVGQITLRIRGARFTPDTNFKLVNSINGNVTDALQTYYRGSALAFATFAVSGIDHGEYDLRAVKADSSSATLTNALSIGAGTGSRVEANISGPPQLRWKRNGIFYANYGNIGDNDGMPPLLIVRTINDTPFGISLDTLDTEPIQILGSSKNGVAGILRPGETYSFPLYFYAAYQTVRFTVDAVTVNDTTPMDWDSMEAGVRPDFLSDAEWSVLWDKIKTRVGNTWGDYVRTLSEVASFLGARGEETWDVRVLFRELIYQEGDFPSAQISGQLINKETGQMLAGVKLAVYDGDVSDSGISNAIIRHATTDMNGNFTFIHVPNGTYDIYADGYLFDVTQKVTVASGSDAMGVMLYAYPIPDENIDVTPVYADKEPTMVTDSYGVTHLVWIRGGNVCSAIRSGGQWTDFKQITTNNPASDKFSLSGLRVKASNKLLDQHAPGIIASWQCNTGNLSRIDYMLGRKVASGTEYEWSHATNLINSSYQDADHDTAIATGNKVLVVFRRKNAAAVSGGVSIYDDNDLYYAMYNMTTSGVDWTTPVAIGSLEENNGIIPNDGSAGADFTISFEGSSGPLPARIPLIGCREAKFSTELQGAIQGDGGCSLSASFSGTQIMNIFDYVDVKLAGGGNLGYGIKCPEAEWRFKAATLNLSGSVEAFIPVGVWEIPGDGWLADKYVEMKIGPTIGVSLSGTAGWVGGSLPGWPNAGNISMSVSLGGKGEVAVFDDAAKGSVSLEGKVTGDLLPKRKITETSITLKGEVESGSYKKSLNATWSWAAKDGWFGFGGASAAPLNMLQSDTGYTTTDNGSYEETVTDSNGTLTVIIGAPTLTWLPQTGIAADYSDTNADVFAVLGANVTNSVNATREDGKPTLARSDAGNILLAWTRSVNPDTFGQDGDEIQVATLNNTNGTWNLPVTIAGSIGYNSMVSAAFHSSTSIVVWSHIDTTGLNSTSTVEQLDAHLATNSIVYSYYNGSTWTAPTSLYTVGRNSALTIGKAADGRVLAAWVNRPDETSGRRLMVSFWDGSSWSTPEILDNGNVCGTPGIGVDGTDTLAMWTIDAASTDGRELTKIRTAVYRTNTWLAAENLVTTSMSVLDDNTEYNTAGSAGGYIPLPAPNSGCCDRNHKPNPKPKPKPPKPVPDDDYKPTVLMPHDPNDILSPDGYGPERWVRSDEPILYTIRFENDPEWATAPAQEVVINQQLDSHLDPRTFRVGSFGWGASTFVPETSSAFYSKRLDLRDQYGYFVDVIAYIDSTTGQAKWQITTIDPDTGQMPTDPQEGFLPPNNTNGIGEGFVTYTVLPKKTVASGDSVNAKATIVFDTEAPLDTPEVFNTLDAEDPSASIETLPDYTDNAEFTVRWSGNDDTNGSGLAYYDVYVAVNGGPYSIWLDNTTLTQAPFSGIKGTNYSFYCLAVDNTGRSEAKTAADVTTTAGPQTFALVYTSTAGGHLTGTTSQIVDIHSDGVPVTAVAESAFVFRSWDDGYNGNVRVDTNVTNAVNVKAIFDPQNTTRGVPSSWYLNNNIGPGAGEYWTVAQWNMQESSDPDNDHYENWKEYFAGTNPDDIDSFLGLKSIVRSSGNKLTLSWASVAGKSYSIEKCDDIKSGVWSVVKSSITATAPSNTEEIDMPVSQNTVYYRIVVE